MVMHGRRPLGGASELSPRTRLRGWVVLPVLLAAAALILAGSGCGGGSDEEASAGDGGSATLKLGWVKSTANLAAFLAPEFGERNGIQIESVNFATATDAMTALQQGQLDVALLTPIHLIRSIDLKTNLVQISSNVRGITQIVASKDLGVGEGDWDGLEARAQEEPITVGTSRGSINEALGVMTFEAHGLNVGEDIRLANIVNFAQHPEALRNGQVDMVITLEPLASLAIDQGAVGFALPYDSAAGDLNTNYMVRKDWLESNRDAAQKFVSTIVDAQEALTKDGSRELEAARELTGLQPAILEPALDNMTYDVTTHMAELEALAKFAADSGWTSRDVSGELGDWIDDTLVERAQR